MLRCWKFQNPLVFLVNLLSMQLQAGNSMGLSCRDRLKMGAEASDKDPEQGYIRRQHRAEAPAQPFSLSISPTAAGASDG